MRYSTEPKIRTAPGGTSRAQATRIRGTGAAIRSVSATVILQFRLGQPDPSTSDPLLYVHPGDVVLAQAQPVGRLAELLAELGQVPGDHARPLGGVVMVAVAEPARRALGAHGPAGSLILRDTNASAVLTSAGTIPLGSWFRVEAWLLGSATVGQCSFSLFPEPDAVAPAETQTSLATQNFLTTVGEVEYGVAVTTASVGPWNVAWLAATDQGPIGPAFPGALASVFP